MGRKEELRLYVEGILSGRVVHADIGLIILEYLNRTYEIYKAILIGIQKERKQGTLNKRKVQEIKNLVFNNLINLNYPANFNTIKSGLERIEYQYEEAQVKRTIQEDSKIISFFKKGSAGADKFLKGAAPILGLLAILGTIFGAYRAVRKWINETRRKHSELLTKGAMSTFYNTVVLPELKDILEDIIKNKIRDIRQLKKVFYKAVDMFSRETPEIAHILKSWGSDVN